MSWVNNLWKILETIATLTKEVERSTAQIKDLRQDVNALSQSVAEQRIELKNEKEKAKIILEGYDREIEHAKEGLAAKFEILTAALDAKVLDLEKKLSGKSIDTSHPKSLKDGLTDN